MRWSHGDDPGSFQWQVSVPLCTLESWLWIALTVSRHKAWWNSGLARNQGGGKLGWKL